MYNTVHVVWTVFSVQNLNRVLLLQMVGVFFYRKINSDDSVIAKKKKIHTKGKKLEICENQILNIKWSYNIIRKPFQQ